MLHIERLQQLPRNYASYIEEIGAELGRLYGADAEREYLDNAHKRMHLSVAHPVAFSYALMDGQDAAAWMIGTLKDGFGQVLLLHVLEPYRHTGCEAALVRGAIPEIMRTDISGVVAECLPFGPLDVDAAYRDLGFDAVPRSLMMASLDAPELGCSGPLASQPFYAASFPRVAECIVDAYWNHPGRKLHMEVHTAPQAEEFLRLAFHGGFGFMSPEFARVIWEGTGAIGVGVGCQIAPRVGFVLQLAVRRADWGRGIGSRLLREIAEAFRQAGYTHVVLGVSDSNPARRLYERLGFRTIRPVTAYAWWRESHESAP